MFCDVQGETADKFCVFVGLKKCSLFLFQDKAAATSATKKGGVVLAGSQRPLDVRWAFVSGWPTGNTPAAPAAAAAAPVVVVKTSLSALAPAFEPGNKKKDKQPTKQKQQKKPIVAIAASVTPEV